MEAAPEEDSNPFAEDIDETSSPSQEDSPRQMNGKEGVPVRALYDYTVTEEDELPLKAGEFSHKTDVVGIDVSQIYRGFFGMSSILCFELIHISDLNCCTQQNLPNQIKRDMW